MKNSDKKLIFLLWAVIVVLVVGGIAITILLVGHANTVDKTNSDLNGNNASLKRQVDQLRAAKNATPTPVAIPTPPTAASTPTPTATPKTKS